MADQDLRIKVAAETGAAQDALGRLSDEMAGLATTTKGAGGDLKDLHKQTAATTAQVNAARDAVERAKRAQSEAAAITQAFGKDSREAAEAISRLKAAEEAATKATRDAERAIEANARAISETAKAAGGASPQLRRMADSLEKTGKDADRTAGELRALEARIESTTRASTGLSASFASFKGNLAANAVTALAGGLASAGMYALETAANFERMQTALQTTLGSTEAANAEFARLQAFAAATPFSLEEVTDGFIKLKNRGLDAGERAMKAYGDTAGAMGKTMNDVVEAVADATQGEGERLKELGINMHKAGDQVSLTFRGVTQTVKFEAKAIEDYLIKLGETNFAGGMEAQSRTLGGMWSTLKDGVAQFTVSIMNSGITDGLKTIMTAFGGLSETGELLSTILGTVLGGAIEGLGLLLMGALPLVDLFSEAINLLISPIKMAKEALDGLAGSIANDFKSAVEVVVVEQEKLRAELVATANATPATNAAIVQGIEYLDVLLDQAGAHLAVARAAKEREDAEARLQAKFDKQAAKESDRELEESMFIGPALPPGYKKPSKGKKKKVKDNSRELSLGGAESFEKHERFQRESAFAAQVQAFEDEQKMRERRVQGLDVEIGRLSQRADLERESIDLIVYTVTVEGDAARARDELMDARLRKEMQLANWEAKNAKTREQRERAQTRVFEVESKKRALAVQREVAAEAKEHARREQVVSKVAGAVMQLGEGMISAFERMAAGEKGAIASMLSELLKGVAKKHTILALGEAAEAVGAAASYRYAAAAQHGISAGMHIGVAAAAGTGAYVAGQIADSRAGTGDYAKASAASGGGSSGSGFGRPGSGGGGGSDDEGLDAQEVPVSHEQMRRGNPGGARKGDGGGTRVVVQGPVHLYGGGGIDEFADRLRGRFDRQDRGGKRARN